MIFKLISIGIIGALLVTLLRTAKPEFAALAAIGTGVVIVIILVNSLSSAVLAFDQIVEKSGLSMEMFSAVLKIIGIGYLTEYSASICEDAGCASIAQKLQIGGKLTIFLMSISIVTTLLEAVSSLLALVN
ncbi:MAG: SpoIIIAC/SpoIIIAD family protein [Clostridia bacterium]|nr:SpoIIIAC/SpoIIIAD family protein [Clostridia bacterium]